MRAMPHSAVAVSALCVVMILGGALSAAPVGHDALPKTEGWIEAETASFTIYSNAGERRTRRIAEQLERFRQALGRMTRGMKTDSQVPTSTFVFKNDSNYEPYKKTDDGKTMNVSGYFVSRPFRNYITLDASAGSQPMRTVHHEYFHAVVSNTFGSLPLWLNEGLAEYFSTFKDREGSPTVEVGHPIESHLVHLAQRGTIGWDDVFDTTTDSATYNEGTRQGSFYAQSWLLVHYLNADDRRSKQLGTYLTLLRAGREEEAAFVEAFGIEKGAMGARVDEYRKTGSGHISWDFAEEQRNVDVAVRGLEPAEVLFRLGELLAQSGQRGAASTHLTAAREAGWPATPIETALGVAAVHANDDSGAETLLRRAIEAGIDSAEPYALLGNLIVRRFFESGATGRPARETPPPVLEARSLYERALQRQPGHFNTLVSFAHTFLFGSEDATPGVRAIERARTFRPLDPDMLEVLAALTARAGSVSRAYEIIVRDIELRDRKAARKATELVTDAAVTLAVARLDGGDRDGAIEILTTATQNIRDGRLRAMVDQLRDVVASGGSILVNADAVDASAAGDPMKEAVAAYNEGVALIGARRYEEALAKFEAIAAACLDERMCASARKQVEDLRRVIQHNRFVAKYNEAVRHANAGDRKAAVDVLRELEATVQDPEKLADVQQLLRELGARVPKR